MWHYQRVLLLWIGVMALVSGCKEEKTYTADALNGHWEVFRAQRDGSPNRLVVGAVFQFDEDGTMRTNITGEESHGTYSMDGDKIKITGMEADKMEIYALHGDSLHIGTVIRDMQFDLYMHRSVTEAN